MATHNILLEAALGYAGRSWPVFAVSFSKVPFKGSHGFLDATTERAAIEAMWRKHPRANVALATGKIVVFDCDGEAGLARFLALGRGPRTLVARTPRGGWHFYYEVPEGVLIRSKAEVRPAGTHDGLDIRGQGGFVLLPPSQTKDGSYSWASDDPIALLPDYLIACAERLGARAEQTAKHVELPPHLVAARLPDSGSFVDRMLQGMTAEWTAHEAARIASALNSIGSTISYDDFLKIGFSLHSLSWVHDDGCDEGFLLWDQWASRFPATYNQDGLQRKWESFGRNKYPNRTITIGTLYKLAGEAGWRGDVTIPAAAPSPRGTNAPPRTMPAMPSAPAGPPSAGSVAPGAGQVNGTALALPASFTASPIIFPDRDRLGRPKDTCRNAVKAIQELDIKCSNDVFHDRMLIGGHVFERMTGDLSDRAVAALRDLIEKRFGFEPCERNARDAAIRLCLQHQFNPVTDYLDGLAWDGTPRIGRWVSHYLGAPEGLCNAFGRLMLVAAVRRARHPGCKFDQIIVLEGPQGIGKSTAIRILAGPENFSDQHILGLREREQQEAAAGVWIHELAELKGMRRAEAEHHKQFARRTEDRARPAWGRFREDKKRQCIFVATTNESDYLKEYDRAFWPIPCGAIALTELQRDRDQLWAEAAHDEANGDSLELGAERYALAQQHIEARLEVDSWENMVRQAIGENKETSVEDILTGSLFHLAPSEITQINQNRVARALKKMGFEKYRQRQGNILTWRYRIKAGT